MYVLKENKTKRSRFITHLQPNLAEFMIKKSQNLLTANLNLLLLKPDISIDAKLLNIDNAKINGLFGVLKDELSNFMIELVSMIYIYINNFNIRKKLDL